jgi:hypothetical protein
MLQRQAATIAVMATLNQFGASMRRFIEGAEIMTNRQQRTAATILSVMFLGPASFKLLSVSLAVEHFTTWGLPIWMMHFIGACELAGAIGLLIPQTRLAASFALFLLMVGGLFTHLVFGEYLFALMPIVYGAGVLVVLKQSAADAVVALRPVAGSLQHA